MPEYLPYAESVTMLREALRRNFPGIKFSVAKSYQRGTSVRVCYSLGPVSSEVDRVAQRFHGADFDGMTDSTTYTRDILVAADGTIRDVRHGIRFVFVERDIPQALYDATIEELASGWEPKQWAAMPDYERERLARSGLCKLALDPNETPASVARRAVRVIFGEGVTA